MGSGDRTDSFDEPTDVLVSRLAERQHALVAGAQAEELGMSRWAIQRRVESGRWHELLPRVYRVAGAPTGGRQTAMAAALWAGDGAAVSHLAAAVLWGFDGVEATRVEVTVPYSRAPRHPAVDVHRTSRWPAVDRDVLHGIPITSPARTIVDVASMLRGEDLEAVLEDALRRRLCRPAFLEWRLQELGGKGRRGAGELSALLTERGRDVAATEYRLELKISRLLLASRLPRPVRQHWVTVEDESFRLDFAWPAVRVAVEGEGIDAHGGRRAFARDRRRVAELARVGWRILPVTWDQVVREPERIVATLDTMLGRAFIEAVGAETAPTASMKPE